MTGLGRFAWVGVLLMAGSGVAQTVTGSGTTSTIPVFTGASTLGNSVITQSNGNIGIGTTSPVFPLDVAGGGRFNWRTTINAPGFSDVSNPALLVNDTESSATWMVPYASISANAGSGVNIIPSVCGASAGSTSNCGYFGLYYAGAGSANNYLTMGITGFDHLLNVFQNGNVGIGTTTPGAKLELNGNMLLTAGSGASVTFPDGTVQSTAWNGVTVGGDYAESVDIGGNRQGYEPGDVIAIDRSSPGRFAKSEGAYSRLVAGVYSTKPGLVGRRTTAVRVDKEAEVPMAMMGIVPTKVSAENGPIETGDLLVTAKTPGYAMKGTDRDRLTGAVIGKALAPLAQGVATIEVLISLQ